MSQNTCDRCDRKLVDPNAQYGWRCAKLVGSPVNSNATMAAYSLFERNYLSKLIRAAEKIAGKVSRETQKLIDTWKSAVDSLQKELKNGLTKAGYTALDKLLEIAIGLEAPIDKWTSDWNFQHNIGFKFDDFIYDQTTGDAAKLKVGAFGTGSANGCGPVAIYNALRLLGERVQPAYVIRHLDTTGGALVGGLLGINPKAVENAFMELEYNVNHMYLPKNLDVAVKESHVSVLAYAHNSGAHYVAIEYVDGEYHVYNEYPGDKTPRKYDSIDNWVVEGNFLPISLVTIPKAAPQPPRRPTYTHLI